MGRLSDDADNDTDKAIFDLQVALLESAIKLKEAEAQNVTLGIELHTCRHGAEADQRRGLRLSLAHEALKVENAKLLK